MPHRGLEPESISYARLLVGCYTSRAIPSCQSVITYEQGKKNNNKKMSMLMIVRK